jgi:integrase/recombinase XerC
MNIVGKYISYVKTVRRYSQRTVEIYDAVLRDFVPFACDGDTDPSDSRIIENLIPSIIRSYEVYLLDADSPKTPRTVNLHLSVLSGFCKFLIKEGHLKSNPVKLVPRPKVESRLPVFYKKEGMDEYFHQTEWFASSEELESFKQDWNTKQGKQAYEKRLARAIISTLYSLGLRRSELIGMTISDMDFGRKVVKVRGKGNKMREIPLTDSLSEEILLYLKAVEVMCGGERSLKEPLFITYTGRSLYPAYVDRAVKSELGDVKGLTGRKSPHVLRHSLATELMNEEADLNSVKELLGHSSLAATQVYTHSSIARLKDIYKRAHPRAKNGGKYGD